MLTLKEKQACIRDALDFDQIREVRYALESRKVELEKLRKKEGDLGLDPHHIRDVERIINGDETTAGLLAIIAQHPAATETETVDDQGDVFYDEAVAAARNGAPGVTSKTVHHLLLLVEDDVPEFPSIDTVEGWSQEEREHVAEWAGALHVAASDNDVDVPPRPKVLGEWPGLAAGEPVGEEQIEEAEFEVVDEEPAREALEDLIDQLEAPGWMPTPELVEEARVYLGQHVGEEWPDLITRLMIENRHALARTIELISEHGWGIKTRPAAIEVGQKLKTTKDLRRTYEVSKVFDDRIEVSWGPKPQRPYIERTALEWSAERGIWLCDVALRNAVVDVDDVSEGEPVAVPWEEEGAEAGA